VWPLPDKEAGAETVNAIAFASAYHTAWFWSGVMMVWRAVPHIKIFGTAGGRLEVQGLGWTAFLYLVRGRLELMLVRGAR
jgi:hypothetical protein